jgi:hypothetical protein
VCRCNRRSSLWFLSGVRGSGGLLWPKYMAGENVIWSVTTFSQGSPT